MSPKTKRLTMEGMEADTLDALVDSTWHSGEEHEVSDVEVEAAATEDEVTLGSSVMAEERSVPEVSVSVTEAVAVAAEEDTEAEAATG